MMAVIRYKHVIIPAVVAILLCVLGAVFKILHWALPYGSNHYFGGEQLMVLGSIFWFIAGVLLIVKAAKAGGGDVLNR